MELTVQDSIYWIKFANERIQSEKEYLTSLDQAIGDSDHGINMARGFQQSVNKISDGSYVHVSDVFKDVAMTMMSKVGGASGPLYGTAFLRLSSAVKEKNPLDHKVFVEGLEDALNGIKQRGKANKGEKTMVDVWEPVVTLLNKNNEVTAEEIVNTAKEAMEHTKKLVATKGRASYFKEKSIGHIDPGSASSFYLFESLAKVWKSGGQA
ncbi:dihydroxyacetone kinase subunit DhaL [Oceanobacillus salinisoli]|uniref:dihydroxyacetone kinase subunit DhaL n=1 Tax=Oceanobacillus salinisoli TaxID=2678611 RepID=UPI0012E29ED2|nr:dihydroxyacetone kinase subunit DhaL [Oceanobacillus salinisoli]